MAPTRQQSSPHSSLSSWSRRLAMFSAMGVAACIGDIGDRPDGKNDNPSGGDLGGLGVSAGPLRRLTRIEYEATLRDLFGPDAVSAAALPLSALPTDRGAEAFSSMAVGVTTNHVDGWFRVADAVAGWVVADPARTGALAPCLASAADETCVRGFIDSFGRRLFRRPLAEGEAEVLWQSYSDGFALASSPADGLHMLLLSMMQAAPFLYRVEIAGSPIDLPDTYRLDPFELATRLSYFAWGSTPDEELLDAAEQGGLDDDAGLGTQIERLFADPRAAAHVSWFFTEWLDLDRIPTPQQSPEFLDGIAPETLAADMRAELEAFAAHQVFDTGGNLTDLFTSTVTLLSSPALAAVYGVDPAADPAEPIELPAGQRTGLLTRAGVLASAGETTHPVRRGAFVRKKLLCDPIPPPDPKDFPPNSIVPPPFDAEKSARQRWTEQTSAAACASCHSRINPIGYVLENYDTLGRWRTEEPIVDPTTGEVVNNISIDATVEVELDIGAPVQVAGAAELGAALAASPTATDCFARQYLRFAQGRLDTADDEALIEQLAQVAGEQGLLEMMKHVARSPAFRLNRIEP